MDEAKREATRKWLHEQGLRNAFSSTELGHLQSLLGSEAFGLFWSLLAYERAESQIQLTNMPLTDAAHSALASVIQGQIRMIDRIREHLLDITDPPKDEEPQEPSNLYKGAQN